MTPPLIKRAFLSFAAVVLASAFSACVTHTRTATFIPAEPSDCVVLLHGLNASWRAMENLAFELQQEGYSTVNVDYPSQGGSIEVIGPTAVNSGVDQCRKAGASRIHFVTHSMGGILLRYAHASSPIEDLGRVVMLAPPNQGTEVIDKTRDWPGIKAISGEAASQLGTDEGGLIASLGPVDFELGVIAGTASIHPWTSVMIPDTDDGMVGVDRTKVEGMRDFLIVDETHRNIKDSDTVVRNIKAFLRDGRFEDL